MVYYTRSFNLEFRNSKVKIQKSKAQVKSRKFYFVLRVSDKLKERLFINSPYAKCYCSSAALAESRTSRCGLSPLLEE